MLTHRVIEGRMNEAIARIEALESVQGPVTRIRMESLSG
jgi:homoserine dehydrogenase